MFNEENLTRPLGERILLAVVLALLIGVFIAIKIKIIDLSALVEVRSVDKSWQLTTQTFYIGVVIVIGFYAFFPNKYKTARLYEDWLELTKSETTIIHFQDIFKLIRNERSIAITLKNGTRITFECRKKSTFPYLLESKYLFWKYGNEDER